MAERKAYHQLDPVKIKRAEFERLPLRQEVKGEKYVDGARYRDAVYAEDVFTWQSYPKGAETKGEWQSAAADLKD